MPSVMPALCCEPSQVCLAPFLMDFMLVCISFLCLDLKPSLWLPIISLRALEIFLSCFIILVPCFRADCFSSRALTAYSMFSSSNLRMSRTISLVVLVSVGVSFSRSFGSLPLWSYLVDTDEGFACVSFAFLSSASCRLRCRSIFFWLRVRFLNSSFVMLCFALSASDRDCLLSFLLWTGKRKASPPGAATLPLRAFDCRWRLLFVAFVCVVSSLSSRIFLSHSHSSLCIFCCSSNSM